MRRATTKQLFAAKLCDHAARRAASRMRAHSASSKRVAFRCWASVASSFAPAGRSQGAGARTHLVGPALAAAAAVTGKITDVRKLIAGGA